VSKERSRVGQGTDCAYRLVTDLACSLLLPLSQTRCQNRLVNFQLATRVALPPLSSLSLLSNNSCLGSSQLLLSRPRHMTGSQHSLYLRSAKVQTQQDNTRQGKAISRKAVVRQLVCFVVVVVHQHKSQLATKQLIKIFNWP
jgi:hypothetical protein